MKVFSIVGLFAGLAVLVWLIAWQGVAEIAALLIESGWQLLLVPLIWVPTFAMTVVSWWLLFEERHRPRLGAAFLAQWMGRAVNTLLPVATIGGEIVKARLLILWGSDSKHTIAATVIDKTVQVASTIVWGLIGLALFVWVAVDATLALWGIAGLAILAVATAGFVAVQRLGMFAFMAAGLRRLAGRELFGGAEAAMATDSAVAATYRRYGPLCAATLWRIGALVLQSGEVWLAAMLLGHPISIAEAILLKSLTSTLSDVAFIVPNSYGVQEGAFVVLGALVGLPPDAALAVSLALRIREAVVDVPGLLLWQHLEGRALFRRRKKTNGAAEAN